MFFYKFSFSHKFSYKPRKLSYKPPQAFLSSIHPHQPYSQPFYFSSQSTSASPLSQSTSASPPLPVHLNQSPLPVHFSQSPQPVPSASPLSQSF